MIAINTLARLRAAFERGVSSRMAAVEAGCSFDTARYYRRALEAAGVIAPMPIRRFKDGRLVHVTHIGQHFRTGAAQPDRDLRRRQYLMEAA